MEKQIIQCEYDMWEAASHKDVASFKELVSPDAVMVCGGYRCLGHEYAAFLPDFDICGYTIANLEIIHSTEDEALLHYVIEIDVESEEAMDLAGKFHVTSFWKKQSEGWRLFFNMDSKIQEC